MPLTDERLREYAKSIIIDGRECAFCRFCGQPMKPKGVRKSPDEYDHAQGCPYSRKRKVKV